MRDDSPHRSTTYLELLETLSSKLNKIHIQIVLT